MSRVYQRKTEIRTGVFWGNPWELTKMEAKVLIHLVDCTPQELCTKLGLRESTIRSHVANIQERMRTKRIGQACVYWDRWWQNWQRANPDSASIAKIQLDL